MSLIHKLNGVVCHLGQDRVVRYKNLSLSAVSQALSLSQQYVVKGKDSSHVQSKQRPK